MCTNSRTPYSDHHAERVAIVADTYDPESLVVPYRKAMNLEIERDQARAYLRETIIEVQRLARACGWDGEPSPMDVWKRAAGIVDAANTNLSGGVSPSARKTGSTI